MQTVSSTYTSLLNGSSGSTIEQSGIYQYRKAGGDIQGELTSEALKKLTGATIAWNQLIGYETMATSTTANGITYTKAQDGSLTITGDKDTTANTYYDLTGLMPSGAVYLIYGATTANANEGGASGGYNIFCRYNGGGVSFAKQYGANPIIIKPSTSSKVSWYLQIQVGSSDAGIHFNEKIYPVCYDLSRIFGNDVADHILSLETATQGAGVSYIEKMFPTLVKKYHPYNVGALYHVNASAHRMVGRNQYNHSTGTARCIGGVEYIISGTYSSVSYVDDCGNAETITIGTGGTFTPSANGTLTVVGGSGSSTMVCINTGGTIPYASYHANDYQLDNTLSLYGEMLLDSNNAIYYSGNTYESVGTVTQDWELYEFDGSSDENWSYASGSGSNPGYFYIKISSYNSHSYFKSICNRAPLSTNISVSNSVFGSRLVASSAVSQDRFIFRMPETASINTAANFKTWLASNPISVVLPKTATTTTTASSFTEEQAVTTGGTEEFVDYGYSQGTKEVPMPVAYDADYTMPGSVSWKEVQVVIADDYTYGADKIIEMTVSSALFSENTLSFGGTVSKKLNLRFYPGTDRANIPTMAKLVPQVRLNNGTQTSEWLDKGTYFIDTRKYDPLTGIMEIEAYDAMLKAEEYYILNDPGTWPRTMSTVVSDIASRLGVTVDSRSTIGNYNVQLPIDYTMREVLSYIAAANGGNFVITWEDKLRLIRFFDTTDSTNLYNNCSSFVVSDSFPTISKVVLDISDDTYVEAGNTTGYTITAKCPWATQAMANALLSSLSGMSWHYLPFTADNATLDPSMELGDYVTIASTKVMLCSQDIFFDALFCSDITAPVDEEINHEYPYETSQQRDIVRRVKTAEASIEVLGDEISLKVSAGDIASAINQTAQSVLIQASKIDLSGYATFSSLSTAGQTTINGSNITTGTINASLIDTSTLRVEEVYYKTGSTFYRIVHGETSGSNIAAVFGLQNQSNSVVSLMGNGIQFLDGINTTAKGIEIQMSSKTIDFWPSGDWVLGSNARSINGAFFDYVYLVTTTTAHGLLYASGNHLYYEDPSGTRHTLV